MKDIQTILTERVNDIPLLLEQMQRMNLPTLIDQHFPAHGHWCGLSLGWVSTIWLSSILSRGDHRLGPVEPWVANRLWTLQTVTDQDVNRLDFTDDRLEIVLRQLSGDSRWAQFENSLNQHTVRVYDYPGGDRRGTAPVVVGQVAVGGDPSFGVLPRFHLQVNLGIDVCRLKRHMSQPGPDRVDVDSCPQQMDSCRMTPMSFKT